MKIKIFPFILTLIFVVSACTRPTTTPTDLPPSPTPVPVTATAIALPTVTPTATPSILGLVDLTDSGAPTTPQIVAQYPAGGRKLARGESIEITFDQPMDTTLDNVVQVIDSTGSVIAGNITWKDSKTVAFVPAIPLPKNSLFSATLSTNLRSAAGLTFSEPFSFDFESVDDLQVSGTFPSASTSDVEQSTAITVMFNQPVVPLVIVEDMDTLPQPLSIEPAVEGSGEWLNTSVYVFRPTTPLRGGTVYRVSVTQGLQGTDGGVLQEAYTWQFTTRAPLVGEISPRGQVNNWDTPSQDMRLNQPFEITFAQPMETSATQTAIQIVGKGGDTIPLSYEWNETGTRVIITPTVNMPYAAAYALTVTEGARDTYGSPIANPTSWAFSTVQTPALLNIFPVDGTVQTSYDGSVQITFATPMDVATLQDNIRITPEPENGNWYWDEWAKSYNLWGLQPSMAYTIEVLPGMRDVYGTPLPVQATTQFTTGPYDPFGSLQMPWETPLFRADTPAEILLSTTNVRQATVSVYRLSIEQYVDFAAYRASQWDYVPPAETLIWQETQEIDSALNQRKLSRFIPSANGANLPNGAYFVTMDSPNIRNPYQRYDDTRVFIVGSANLTLKTGPEEALVWLTDLTSGAPVFNIPVTVYDEFFNSIGTATTDKRGVATLALPVQDEPWQPRFAIAQGETVFGFASNQWGSGVSSYDFGIWADYYTLPNQPRVYLYTDRPIYRPGQPVYLKGIARMNDDLAYSLPDAPALELVIESYQGEVLRQQFPLNGYGSFETTFELDTDAALGSYTVYVTYPGSPDYAGFLTFNVAEYRKPEFQVEVTTPQPNALPGNTLQFDVLASYFSGGYVRDAEVYWNITAQDYNFAPGGEYSRYSFTDNQQDIWYYFEDLPNPQTLIADGQTATGADGQATITQIADLGEQGTSQRFTFESTVLDLADNAVSGRTDVVVHQSAVYAGIRANNYVGTENKTETFDIIVLDWNEVPLAGHSVNVEIVERKWNSVQVQEPGGGLRWETNVEEISVASANNLTTDENGRVTASFVPEKGGVYRGIVTTSDGQGNLHTASAYMWVASSDFIPWRQNDQKRLDLVANADSYLPGETAEILIASPFQGSHYALVTLERGHITYSDVVLLESNSQIYQLPITGAMAPNMYVSVIAIKGAADGTPADFRMGMVELKVATEQQVLNVEITPDVESAGPGDEVTYSIRTTDANGSPVPAEVSLALTDLATLTLSPPNAPTLEAYFYDDRYLSIRTAIPLINNIEAFNLEVAESDAAADGRGIGSGGGKGAGEFGVFDVREDFPDTAFWRAGLVTDGNGTATISVTLPDNLTTWRMDARAITLDTRVGQSTYDILATKPLLVRPQTPRFFVVRDETRLATIVQNNSGDTLTAEVSLAANGVTIHSDETQVVTLAPNAQTLVTWDITVNASATRVDAIFSARAGNLSDASRPPLGTLDQNGIPVYKYEAPETVGTAGQLDNGGSQVEAIQLPTAYDVTDGELIISLSPSLAAGMTDGLDYLEHYPYECTEQTISRFLPNILTLRALQQAGINDPALEDKLDSLVGTALQKLVSQQNPDGGWGWWNTSQSHSTTSAYVIFALTEAQNSGYAVNADMFRTGVSYLQRQIRQIDVNTSLSTRNRQAFILYVLAHAGAPDVSATVQLFELRAGLSHYGKAYLANALYTIDSGDPRLDTLISDLATAAIQNATGTHWEEVEPDYWNWNTDTRSTAIILGAFLKIAPDNPLATNAVRWLMINRTEGYWPTTQETAWTLIAFTEWMVYTGELTPDYAFGAALNNTALGEALATPETVRDTLNLRVQVSGMVKDTANRLVIARTEGDGNLYYTAHLTLNLPVEQIQPLDRGIVVSRQYFSLDAPDTAITAASPGDLLLARVTIVVPSAMHYLVVDDPLPAGFEGVDQSLETSVQNVDPEIALGNSGDGYESYWRWGWGWWAFDRIEFRDEKVVLSASYLDAGTYTYTYLVRATTPGTYHVIPPTAQEFYFPEVYGRGAGSLFTVGD